MLFADLLSLHLVTFLMFFILVIIYHDTKVGNTASTKLRNSLMNNIINEMTSLTYSKLELSICLHSLIAATGIRS